MARKTYKLEHFAKGTGATVVPNESDAEGAGSEAAVNSVPVPRERRRASRPAERRKLTTPLPPGHVRKKSTGEIGRVESVDPKGGTVVVRWLREGRTTTIPLAAISRR